MRKIVLVLMLLFVSGVISAQSSGFGLKAGVNFANMNLKSNREIDTKPKTALHFGVSYDFVISDNLTIRPEFLYSMQGCKYDQSNVDAGLNLNYISVPVVLNYYLSDIISLHAGPQLGFLLKAELEVSGDAQDIKDEFHGGAVDGLVGLEVDLNSIVFGTRYYAGLINLQKASSTMYSEVKSKGLQLYVAYRIKK